MPKPQGYATRYSASSSSHRHSLGPTPAMSDRASCGFLQRGRPGDRRGELAAVLWPWLRRLAAGKSVEHLAKRLLGEVLGGLLPDQDHRTVHAGVGALTL